jgi:hypothetical protein
MVYEFTLSSSMVEGRIIVCKVTVHLCCVNISTISERTKMSFHLGLVT